MKTISSIIDSKIFSLILGGVVFVLMAFGAYAYFKSTITINNCIATPVLTEKEKFWVENTIIGGPKDQWIAAKDANDVVIPNTFIMNVAKKDKIAGYDLAVPQNSMMVATVVETNKCTTRSYIAYGKSGSYIQGNYKVISATLYTKVESPVDTKAGSWGIIDPKTNQLSQVSLIGMPFYLPSAVCESQTLGSVATKQADGGWKYAGKPTAIALREGDALSYYESGDKIATGPAVLNSITAATIYCRK